MQKRYYAETNRGELAMHYDFAGAVQRLTSKLAFEEDLDQQVRSALEIAIDSTGCSGGSVLLHNPEQHELRFVLALGQRAADRYPQHIRDLVSSTIRDDEGIAGKVFQSGIAEYENDAKSNPSHSSRIDEAIHHHTENLATVPICIRGGMPVGVIQLVNRPGGFGDDEMQRLGALASIVALSMMLRITRSRDASAG